MPSLHCIGLIWAAMVLAGPLPAGAADLAVVGLFPNKVVVQIDGGKPRTLSLNQKTEEGITLLAVERDAAIFDIGGRRRTLKMGQAQSTSSDGLRAAVTLAANAQGHFVTDGQVNGVAVRFIVDTGATLISLSSADATRIGISYLTGKVGMVRTANGTIRAFRVTLDSVRIGEISVNNIDAMVLENQSMPALLGMSFLNRTEMKHDGTTMVLTKRF